MTALVRVAELMLGLYRLQMLMIKNTARVQGEEERGGSEKSATQDQYRILDRANFMADDNISDVIRCPSNCCTRQLRHWCPKIAHDAQGL